MKPRILFIHYHTGERDGVGLEIEKRAQIFQKLGAQTFYLSGLDKPQRPNAYLIPELYPKQTLVTFMREYSFRQKLFDENTMIALHHQLEAKIYKKLQKAFHQILPDLVFVHNLFSLAWNLPATTALVKLLDKRQPPTVVLNHDFWWERKRYQKPKYYFVKEIIDSLPPRRHYIIKHQVINSLAQKNLLKKRQIKAEKIGDYFDYHQPPPQPDEVNSGLKSYFKIKPHDLLILQATRIMKRKAIENAIIFAQQLEKKLKKLAPLNLNGKTFSSDSRVILLFSNYVEFDELKYYNKLRQLVDKTKTKVIWGWEKFAPQRHLINGTQKYSFWDSYLFADLVTYTSTWEGFGNQFLETLFFKKLPVVFEYPVFEKDIKKEGYRYVSLGNQTEKKYGLSFVNKTKLNQAVNQAIHILQHPSELTQITQTNFQIAQEHHDEQILKKDLALLLQNCSHPTPPA